MLCPASCSSVFIELSAPCALLRFIKEREPCLESEKKGQAIEKSLARSRELLENGEIIRSLVKEGPTTTLS